LQVVQVKQDEVALIGRQLMDRFVKHGQPLVFRRHLLQPVGIHGDDLFHPIAPPPFAPVPAHGCVQGDAVNPGGRFGLPVELLDRTPQLNQDFLHQILLISRPHRVGPGHLEEDPPMRGLPVQKGLLSFLMRHLSR
jgi:hypothetical protein